MSYFPPSNQVLPRLTVNQITNLGSYNLGTEAFLGVKLTGGATSDCNLSLPGLTSLPVGSVLVVKVEENGSPFVVRIHPAGSDNLEGSNAPYLYPAGKVSLSLIATPNGWDIF